MKQYGLNILKGAARAQMATLLVDICGFSGSFAGKGITMPFSPDARPL